MALTAEELYNELAVFQFVMEVSGSGELIHLGEGTLSWGKTLVDLLEYAFLAMSMDETAPVPADVLNLLVHFEGCDLLAYSGSRVMYHYIDGWEKWDAE